MKIQKFNENINIDEVEEELIENYNHTDVSYDVMYKWHAIESSVMTNIKKIDDAIYYCEEGKNRSPYKDSHYFIIKKEIKSEILTREEIELYKSSNKYGL